MSVNEADFRLFEANSRHFLPKIIEKWGRFGALAADSFFCQTGSKCHMVAFYQIPCVSGNSRPVPHRFFGSKPLFTLI